MPIKRYNPTTAARRISSVDAYADLTRHKAPEKSLLVSRKQNAGRNHAGKITVRHRGGGARRFIRLVDFRRDKYDVPGKIVAIEYDPNRGARLALIQYQDGEKRYHLAPEGLGVGATMLSSRAKIEMQPGNHLPLELIPIGLTVHNVELAPGRGGQIVRGAGASAQLMAIEGSFATLRLPSGEMRMVPRQCMATIGTVSNPDHNLVRLGKAGRTRHRGIRPTVRGKAMNPVDHPHGGGEGKHPIGLTHPKTAQGKPALGVKTRRHQASDRLIIKRRKPGRFVGSTA